MIRNGIISVLAAASISLIFGTVYGEVIAQAEPKFENFAASDTATFTQQISNTDSDKKDAKLICALYDKSGCLIKTAIGPTRSIAQGQTENLEVKILVPKDWDKDCRVKTFLWEGTDNIKPYLAAWDSKGTTFANPISEDNNADPSVCMMDGVYYAAVAANGNKAIEVYSSHSLTDVYSSEPVTVFRCPSDGAYSNGLWAPDLCYIDGSWYLYFTADNGDSDKHRMFVLKCDTQDPQGSYTYMGQLDIADDYSIDGVPFIAPDGNLYFVWSGGYWNDYSYGNTIYIAPMKSPTEMAMPGTRVRLSVPDGEWEHHGAWTNEAPAVLVKNGTVHIFYSASAGDTKFYCLGRLTCTDGNVMDPASWKKTGPVLFAKEDKNIWGPGSCCFTKSPDGTEDWILFHVKSDRENGWFRQIWAQPITWDGDYPVLGEVSGRGELLKLPSGSEYVK